MSRHIFEQRGYYVQIGWDKPLSHYYCVVAEDRQFHELAYSNLFDNQTFEQAVPLSYFEGVLQDEFNITLPETIRREVKTDKSANVVNRTVYYGDLAHTK